MMTKNYSKYFATGNNLITRYEWNRNPFQKKTEVPPIENKKMFLIIPISYLFKHAIQEMQRLNINIL